MCYSIDFRKKVLLVRAKEGLSLQKVANRFDISLSTVYRWTKRIAPILKRNKPPVKINTERLLEDIKNHPDSYYYERAQRLGVSTTGITEAMKRLGITYKKKPTTSKGQTRRTAIIPKQD